MGCTAERDVGPRVQFGLIFDRRLQAGDEPSVGFGYDREGESAGLALARSLEIASRQGLLVGCLAGGTRFVGVSRGSFGPRERLARSTFGD